MAFPAAHATLSFMKPRAPLNNRIVAALFPIFLGLAMPAYAADLDEMFEKLQTVLGLIKMAKNDKQVRTNPHGLRMF